MFKILSAIVLLVVLGVPGEGRVPLWDFFYAYGHRVPTADDNFIEYPLNLLERVFFFNNAYDKLYVNNNGGISFVRGVPQFTPDCGPQSTPMIIPFWGDVDTRNGGDVYYRESTDPWDREKATNATQKAFPNLNINIEWTFVVTWLNVSFYGAGRCNTNGTSNSDRNITNTFQAVIAKDGSTTFVIFNYENIEWTTGVASGGNCSGLGGTPAKSGFDKGDNVNFFSLPGSCNSDVSNVEFTSNVGKSGQWIFRVDLAKVEDSNGPLEPNPYPGRNETTQPIPHPVITNGTCDPYSCELEGYCTTYRYCNTHTSQFTLHTCSPGLYWNPHSDMSMLRRHRRSIPEKRQSSYYGGTGTGTGTGPTPGTGWWRDPYPGYESTTSWYWPSGPWYSSTTSRPDHDHNETCHGSCDVWDNLPDRLKAEYIQDESCPDVPSEPSTCFYMKIDDCSSQYFYHPHGEPLYVNEVVDCPRDTRHGLNIPLVWVQERETCDFCYNAYSNYNRSEPTPCCPRYDNFTSLFSSIPIGRSLTNLPQTEMFNFDIKKK